MANIYIHIRPTTGIVCNRVRADIPAPLPHTPGYCKLKSWSPTYTKPQAGQATDPPLNDKVFNSS